MRTVPIMKKLFAAVSVVLLGAGLSSCGASTPTSGIVATNAVLASIVQEVVGKQFHVDTVIPDGKDPHEFQPSAGDIARIANARVVVSNGYGYEPTLQKAIASARARGVAVFDAEWDGSSVGDPHWFTDPLRAAEVMAGLLPVLEKALGVSLDSEFGAATTEFQGIVRDGLLALREVPQGRCTYATEHIFLGPFGDRFGCGASVVLNRGSRVPDAEPSAADLERFAGDIKARGIRALVEDSAEHSRVLDRVSEQTGATLVRVNVHGTGGALTYRAYIMAIVDALAGVLK